MFDAARGRQRHVNDFAHPARAGGHQQHLLAEEGRLIDRMGDEQDRRAGVLPDPQQFVVEPVAGDLVERAERLIHQQSFGSLTSARAIATRWRMPPDNSCG